MTAQAAFDVVVVGGGPAGSSAALWAARCRRRVAMIDAGEPRNRWSRAAHGYLGFDGADPKDVLDAAHHDLARYREVVALSGRVVGAERRRAISVTLDDGRVVEALRLVLATGVRDVFPSVDGFEAHFGHSIFTCPSCDGYEAQDRVAAVVGATPEVAEFAVGLLDWASSVVLIRQAVAESRLESAATRQLPIAEVAGRVVAVTGDGHGHVRSLRMHGGGEVRCDVVYWLMEHEQQSDLPRQLGLRMTSDACVAVDENGRTSSKHVYAAGDMTPGPHLVQLAAAAGTRAGIAAAISLRGHAGSPHSPTPAPESEPFDAKSA